MPVTLRSDLVYFRIGPERFLLRDPGSQATYELEAEEHFLLRCLDGQRGDEAICRAFAERFGRSLDRRRLAEFIAQLHDLGLLVESPPAAQPDAGGPPRLKVVDPLSLRAPQGLLNLAFDLLALVLGWLIHPVWIPAVLVLFLGAATVLVHESARIWQEFAQAASDNALWVQLPVFLGMLVGVVSLPRALITGIACRRVGGRVRAFGLALERRLLPYVKCDLGDSVALLDPPDRWTVLLAGPLLQWGLGSLALVAWSAAAPDSILRLFLLLVAARCLIGGLWRLNPLIEGDSYAMLMLWREVPQLHRRAKDQAWAFWTGGVAPEPLSPAERFWFRLYGTAIYLGRTVALAVVFFGGGWFLISHFGGSGAALLVLAAGLWYFDELRNLAMSFTSIRWLVRGGGPWYVRWPVRLALLAALVACGFLPYRHDEGGDFRLVPAAELGIRAQTAGELAEVLVESGGEISAGTTIARIEPREQQAAVAMTEAALAAAAAKRDLLKAGARPEDIEAARQRVELDQRRLDYYETELARIRQLAETNTISAAELANAQFNRDSAEKVYAASKEELAALVSGARAEEIRAAEAEIQRLEAQLARDRQELALAEITSPIGGRIVTAHVQMRRGLHLAPGDLIAVVQDTDRLRAEISATEPAAEFVRVGQPVELRFWGLNGQLIRGRVSEIANTASKAREIATTRIRSDREQLTESIGVDTKHHFVRIYADLEQPPEHLLPEMTGYARIEIGPDVLWRAIARPIQRFVLVEVWSWLP